MGASHVHRRQHRLGQGQGGQRAPGNLGVAVHRHLGQEAQHLAGPVAARGKGQQLGRVLDEARGQLVLLVVDEGRVVDEVFQELQIGGHAADAEFAQRAVHARDGFRGGRRPGRDLDQQRVVVGRDHRAAIGRAGVQPDAEAGRTAVGREPAVVGQEAVFRVFGGDAALQRVAVERDLRLLGHAGGMAVAVRAGRRAVTLCDTDDAAFGDADLRLDDVHAGDHLGDGVLHLDARIDLDEVALAVVGIHQELDRAGMGVAHRCHQLQRAAAQRGTSCRVQVGRRGAFHHLLVAPLHGAVALVQMHQIAVLVAQDLHLDVACAADQLLEIDLVVAEGGQRLAPRGFQRRRQLGCGFDDTHAAAAAAPAGLEHDREADAGCERGASRIVIRQRRRRRHHRHAGRHRGMARRHLVAQRAHHFGARADPTQPGGDDLLGKVRVLRQEAVAGVDGVDAGAPGDAQDVVAVQVGRQRFLALADQVALVGLEAVQRLTVLLRIDRDGADAHLGGGAHHPDGDLGAVRDQDRADEGGCHGGAPVPVASGHAWIVLARAQTTEVVGTVRP